MTVGHQRVCTWLNILSKKVIIFYFDIYLYRTERNITFFIAYVENFQINSRWSVDCKFVVSDILFTKKLDFAIIELNSCYNIHVPDEWCKEIQIVRRKHNFMLVKMQKEDFLKSEEHLKTWKTCFKE